MERLILKELKAWKEKKDRKPLLLKGARQIGKTYALHQFGQNEFEAFHYINFEEKPRLSKIFSEDLSPDQIIQRISLELQKKINTKNDLLILDEIQECPQALTSLKYFSEKLPELAICAAGSLLGVRMADISFPVGKIDHLEMYPLSFYEFLKALDKPLLVEIFDNARNNPQLIEPAHEQLWQLLKFYFITGGLPEAVKTFIEYQENQYEAFTKTRSRQKEIINDYLADMAKHSGKENSMHLQRLWTNVAEQLSQTQNDSANKFKFKGAIPEKNRYSRLISTIDWLEAAGLIIKIPIVEKAELPLQAYTKPNSFKLFVFDLGILGALVDLDPNTILAYDYGTYKGFFAENFVAQEFLAKFTSHKKFYAWQQNRLEVEFLIDLQGELYPIEVKSGTVTKSRSLQIFAQHYKHKYLTIMSAQKPNVKPKNHLQKYPLYFASEFPYNGNIHNI